MNIRWLLFFFYISGFCSLVYEVVWLRLSMAAFGCNAPLVSIVLSIFMAGLGLGSYIAAKLKTWLDSRSLEQSLKAYACCELAIAAGGVLVGIMINIARGLFETKLQHIEWASASHYALVFGFLVLIILPFTTVMGLTLPIGMSIIRMAGRGTGRSFSYLYTANLLGAACGTLLTALVLVEHLGFKGTLGIPILLNVAIALPAFILSKTVLEGAKVTHLNPSISDNVKATDKGAMFLLFFSGLSTMGIEVVWFRLYTVYLQTSVYAFAKILSVYLVANFIGSICYRHEAKHGRRHPLSMVLSVVILTGMFTLVCTDYSHTGGMFTANMRLLLGVGPFSLIMGYLTPMLVDEVSSGEPDKAGRAYALNVAGCILGPLVASFVLLPNVSEKIAIIVLLIPFLILGVKKLVSRAAGGSSSLLLARASFLSAVGISIWIGLTAISVYDAWQSKVGAGVRVERDFEATTIALAGDGGTRTQLLVNGYGMTIKHPVTKAMAHLPLALLSRKPEDVLVICFGMGTTFRSAMTWGVKVDVVDLVPGVPKMFPVFHKDADLVLAEKRGNIIIDDGRRYMQRTTKYYDVITLDPPPPVEAAATSLLYSKQFYLIAKKRLKPGGILQHWVPETSLANMCSMLSSARDSFTYVRTFGSLLRGGIHITCSDSPIPVLSAEELTLRLPPLAAKDFVEWTPNTEVGALFQFIMSKEFRSEDVVRTAEDVYSLTDDRPFNEYNIIRQSFPRWWHWWVQHVGD